MKKVFLIFAVCVSCLGIDRLYFRSFEEHDYTCQSALQRALYSCYQYLDTFTAQHPLTSFMDCPQKSCRCSSQTFTNATCLGYVQYEEEVELLQKQKTKFLVSKEWGFDNNDALYRALTKIYDDMAIFANENFVTEFYVYPCQSSGPFGSFREALCTAKISYY